MGRWNDGELDFEIIEAQLGLGISTDIGCINEKEAKVVEESQVEKSAGMQRMDGDIVTQGFLRSISGLEKERPIINLKVVLDKA